MGNLFNVLHALIKGNQTRLGTHKQKLFDATANGLYVLNKVFEMGTYIVFNFLNNTICDFMQLCHWFQILNTTKKV